MLLIIKAIRERIATRKLKESLCKELVLRMERQLIPLSRHYLKTIPLETFTAHNGDTISLRVWPQLQHLRFNDGTHPEKVFYDETGVLKYLDSGVEGRWLFTLRSKDFSVESLENAIESVKHRVLIITIAKNYVARERLLGREAKDMLSDIRQFTLNYLDRHGSPLSDH